jgi:hypothetical protein
MMQAFRNALARMDLRLFLGMWVGNLVLMLLAAAWLQIPDSHSWQFAFSIFSGVLLVVLFAALYAWTVRHLLVCTTRPAFWRSCCVVLAAVALWWAAQPLIDIGRAHEALYAGYWNSQSPKWLRYHLGYSAIVAWQERIYDCIEWIWAGFVLPLAMQLAACGRATRAYRRWFYWLCMLVCGLGASWLTWALADWTPDAGLAGQTLSVVARLGIAYTVDMVLWCFLLALTAHYVKEPRPAVVANAAPQ